MDKQFERRLLDAKFLKKSTRKLIQKKKRASKRFSSRDRKVKILPKVTINSFYANGKVEDTKPIKVNNFTGVSGGEDMILHQKFDSENGEVYLLLNLDGHGKVDESSQITLAKWCEDFVKRDLILFSIIKKDEEYLKKMGETFSREFHLVNFMKGGTTCTLTILIKTNKGTHIGIFSWGDSTAAIYHLGKNPRLETLGSANADEIDAVQEYVNYCRNNGSRAFLPFHNRLKMIPFLATGSRVVDKNSKLIEEFSDAESILAYICNTISIEFLINEGYILSITNMLNDLRDGKVISNPVCRYQLNQFQKYNDHLGHYGFQGIGSGSINEDGNSWSDSRNYFTKDVSPNIGSSVLGLQTMKSFGDFYHKDYLISSYIPEILCSFVPEKNRAKLVMGSDGLWDVLTFQEIYEEVSNGKYNLYEKMREVMKEEETMKRHQLSERLTHDDVSYLVVDIKRTKVKEFYEN